MPTTTENTIEALAFCPDGRCPGYLQKPVSAVQTVTGVTCAELGGDLPMTERSFEYLRFADEADIACEYCAKDRLVSTQERPEYAQTSGQDPMALLHLGKQEGRLRELEHAAELKSAQESTELADLRAQVAEMRAAIAESKPKPKAA